MTDDEFGRLGELLEQHSQFDIDGALGVLHAVAVAPSLLPPPVWLSSIFGREAQHDGEAGEQVVFLLLRLFNEVVQELEVGKVMVPDPEDVAAWESFAAGYAAGASLDPEWIGNNDRWTFASHIAYLGGRFDLVPEHTRTKLETMLPEPKNVLCRYLGASVKAADDSFRKLRRAELPTASQATRPPAGRSKVAATGPSVARVGRNAPCPCGSGKKYKRCCINRTSPSRPS